jgi:fermentation-respiration switch protein FrsA (DUF1100 family)
VLRHPAPTAVALLWHGRGAREAHVLHRLATALHGDGHTVVTPNWDASAADRGALASSAAPRPAAVVGLAADVREHSPLDGAVPVDRVRPGTDAPPIFLVHGADDAVVPAAGAEEFARACLTAGVPCALTLVESDHAGVVGTEYDPTAGLCVPSDAPGATRGLAAALRASAPGPSVDLPELSPVGARVTA